MALIARPAADRAAAPPATSAGWWMGPVGAWLLPFALVLYLGLSDGGYDILDWGDTGVLAWSLILLGALIGFLPLTSLDRRAWLALGAFAAFVGWSALAIGWSDSTERGVAELARTCTYLGVFVLALGAARAGYARETLNGLTAGVALLGLIALLSRLHPAWFPVDAGAHFLGERNRLDYPLNYFNALAALLALGLVLSLAAATSARTQAARAVATAVMPALALALFFTLSRGGLLAATLCIAVFVALAAPRDRLPALRTLAIAGAGSLALIVIGDQLEAVQDGVRDSAGRREGNTLLALVVLVCLTVGLLSALLERAQGGRKRRRPRRQPRLTLGGVAAAVTVAAALFVVAGGVGDAKDAWDEFRAPAVELGPEQQRGATRLTALSSRGRYQIWRSALDAADTAPLQGIGPGGFEFWWAREGRLATFHRSGHSLYFDTLAELGIVGLLLILAVVATAIWTGASRAVREPAGRPLFAAGAAGCLVFALSAGIEWLWEVAALAVTFFVLAGIVLGQPGPSNPGPAPRPKLHWRLGLALLSIGALVAIVLPLVSTAYVRASEDDVAEARLEPALDDARTAERMQPYAATPKLQQALVYERLGNLGAAARSARAATDAEPTNWRTWLTLSRIDAHRGDSRAALRSYRKARSLNPRSRLFQP